MSIIEKAAGKLDQTQKAAVDRKEPTIGSPPADRADLIVKAADAPEAVAGGSGPPAKAPEQLADAMPDSGGTGPMTDAAPAGEDQGRKPGVVNLDKLRQLGMITPDGERTQISEEFRLIKRPLLVNAFRRDEGAAGNANLIMVTSSLAGEGKTFCAVNLAMSIAMEMDHRVLLVDADISRPALPDYLGLEPGRGLLDVLLDDALDLADVLIRTNVEKLTVLTAGARHRHATELLASQAMSELLGEIAQRYPDRIVIFDAPPLLLTSEARVLASQMGQIVLVVEAEKTTQKTVKEALRQIEACETVHLLFNKARTFPGGDYYGYDYDYN